MTTDFVFLHGGGQGGWVWEETITALQAQSGGRAQCLALDAPGCGAKRERDTDGMTFAEVNRELLADVDAFGMKGAVLVGHSQAGLHLPHMTELRPGLFSRLIFVTCTAPLPGTTTLEQMGNSRHGENPNEVGWPVDPATTSGMDRLRAMFCNDMSPDQADAFMAKLGRDMWPACCHHERNWRRDHLADVPSSYVLCLRDHALTPPWQERFAERLHADRTMSIDAGHQVMNSKPQALAEVLLAESRA
jgi:pimeloyl-ACP methyl ester carboxylesterase